MSIKTAPITSAKVRETVIHTPEALSGPNKRSDISHDDKYVTPEEKPAATSPTEPALKKLPTENRYAQTTSASAAVTLFLKGFLKVSWSIGGFSDSLDGIPRLHSKDIAPLLPKMQPGDIIINGNNGGLSHVSMYVGGGQIVHSMATRHTMLGLFGAIVDPLKEYFGFGPMHKTGVITETFGGFLDRFERDTYVVLRREDLTPEQVQKGVERLKELVGKPYDYDFSANDEEYYCTELTVEFIDAALNEKGAAVFNTVHTDLGFFKTDGIEPKNILEHPLLTPIAASKSAAINFAPWLEDAEEF